MELQVLYDDQTVQCALILLVLINLPKWSYCDAHYIQYCAKVMQAEFGEFRYVF